MEQSNLNDLKTLVRAIEERDAFNEHFKTIDLDDDGGDNFSITHVEVDWAWAAAYPAHKMIRRRVQQKVTAEIVQLLKEVRNDLEQEVAEAKKKVWPTA